MRNEIQAQGSTLTVGELRAALEGVDDGAPVFLETALHGGGYTVNNAEGTDLGVWLFTEDDQ